MRLLLLLFISHLIVSGGSFSLLFCINGKRRENKRRCRPDSPHHRQSLSLCATKRKTTTHFLLFTLKHYSLSNVYVLNPNKYVLLNAFKTLTNFKQICINGYRAFNFSYTYFFFKFPFVFPLYLLYLFGDLFVYFLITFKYFFSFGCVAFRRHRHTAYCHT